MGDRIYLQGMKCAYCGKEQEEDVYYAESCGFTKHICEFCGKVNRILQTFELEKVEER